MSTADADKIDKEVKERDKTSAEEQKAIEKETNPAKKAERQTDHENYDAVTEGMRETAAALRENPNARPGLVIPRLIGVEQAEVKKLQDERDAAETRHDQNAVKRLDRSIELAGLTISGKQKAHELLALAPGLRREEGQFAMKLSIEDDAGRQVVQLTINLFSGLERSPQAIVVRDAAIGPVMPQESPESRPQA